MRRIVSVLLGLLAVVFAAQTAHAEYITCYLDELQMYVDVINFPWIVTRDVADGDPCLDYFECTIEELHEKMEDAGCYLLADSGTGLFAYYVLSSESSLPDFDTLSRVQLEQIISDVKKTCIERGAVWFDGFVYEHAQTNFFCLEIAETLNGKTTFTRQYNTVYNGKYISVGVSMFTSEVNDSLRNELDHMVDSVWFGEELPQVEEPVLAEGDPQIFYLGQPDLEITIPGSFVAFTRDMDPMHPNFMRMGYTWEQVMENMEKGDIYLDALTPDGDLELLVISSEYPMEDLHVLSETQIQKILETRKKQLNEEGVQWISDKVFEHHQAKFLQIDYSGNLDQTTGYAREYYTLYADKIITIALTSYDGKLTAGQEALFAGIINSICFGTEPRGTDTSVPAPKYVDDLTGLVISPPNLWTENPISRPDAGLSMQFTFSANTEKKIQIYSRDLFRDKVLEKLIPDFDRETLARGEAGHELLTAEIVAKLLECDVTKVSNTRCGGREYFRAEITTTVKVGGQPKPVSACALVRMENGYLYVFQYIGATNDGSFLNFRKMVANAAYPTDLSEKTETVPEPEAPPDTGEAAVPSVDMPEENSTPMAGRVILWTVLPGLAVIVFCILVGSKNKCRRIVDPAENPVECDPWERTKPEPVREAPKDIVYCRRCGTQLRTTHRFCHKCGTENMLFRAEDQK